MNMRLKVALAGVVLSASVVSAQQATRPAAATRAANQGTTVSQRAAGEVRSLINGVAVDADQTPVRNTSVRLRNLQVNAIEQVVTTNELGGFTFVAQPAIPYVVEVADAAGRVLAVGDVILTSAGEVAGAVVVLPASLPSLAGGFGETASSVISAATGIGLTVVDPTLPKVSPTR